MQHRYTYITNRGFTGHEHLPSFGIINMNGRVYDPVVARFMSPDNYIQAPNNTQSFNRYSYVLNNPLKYTDPSGWKFTTWGTNRDYDDEKGVWNSALQNADRQMGITTFKHGTTASGHGIFYDKENYMITHNLKEDSYGHYKEKLIDYKLVNYAHYGNNENKDPEGTFEEITALEWVKNNAMDVGFMFNDVSQVLAGNNTLAIARRYGSKTTNVFTPLGNVFNVNTKFAATVTGASKVLSEAAPYVSLGLVAIDIGHTKQINAGQLYVAGLTVLTLAFPPAGLAIGGIALAAEAVSYYNTGKSVSDNINGGLNGVVIVDFKKLGR